MISFSKLDPFYHTIILISFLLLLLTYIHILSFTILRTKRIKIGLIASLNIVFNFIIITCLTTYLYEIKLESIPSYWRTYMVSKPIWSFILVDLMGYIFAFSLIYNERKFQKNVITKASIKETLDNLHTGLSLSLENGSVLLSNLQINRLSYSLTGNYLHDSEQFWTYLHSGDLGHKFTRFTQTSNPIISFSDGRTWSFTRGNIDFDGRNLVEIKATEISDLNLLRSKLEEDNKALRSMNNRLKKYSKDAIEIKAQEERFATKMRIHDDLGYVLLATRQYIKNLDSIENKDLEAKNILNLWKENIEIILGSNKLEKTTALDGFLSAANAIGIQVEILGEFPEAISVSNLLLFIAGECLTNSVKHAHASYLYLEILEEKSFYKAKFSNNGIKPKKEIVEGGGLSGVREKVESIGGSMILSHKPKFSLEVEIPKEGGN